MENHQFSIGDKIIYGTNGLCRIDDITEMKFAYEDEESLYYILVPESNKNSKIYVPMNNELLTSKMRYILSSERIEELLAGAKDKEMEWIDDRMARTQFFHDVLNNGVHEDLLLMIRCIYNKKVEFAAKSKKLSTADDTVLKQAEKLVTQEFSYALGASGDSITKRIYEMLGITK